MRPSGCIVAFTLVFGATCNVQSAEVVHVGKQIVGGSDGARLSADGNTVMGTLDFSPENWGSAGPPFIWTRERGVQILGPFPEGTQFDASGISSNGLTVVGSFGPQGAASCLKPWDTYTWSADEGVTLLPRSGDIFSVLASAISENGSTVVGWTINDVVGCRVRPVREYSVTAFRWTEHGGLTSLALPEGRDQSGANDVSADGSIVVGVASSQDFFGGISSEPVMWNDDGVHSLGPIPKDWSLASASYVSADGHTIVGTSAGSFGSVANDWFRWTDTDGLVELPKLSPDQRGLPFAVSADGSVILGVFFKSNNELTSVVWDEQYGTRDLWDVLIDEHGMTREELGDLNSAVSLSTDTKTLLAFAWSPSNSTYAYDVIYLDKPLVSPRGDFDASHYRDAADIDLLSQAIGGSDLRFDLNSDQIIDDSDRRFWIHSLAHTYYGDANLDGEFNSGDFTKVFLAGEYEDAIDDNSGWAEGDWDGDADFTSQDMIAAFLDGGYEQGPHGAVRAVPEPTAGWMLLVAGLLLANPGLRQRSLRSR